MNYINSINNIYSHIWCMESVMPVAIPIVTIPILDILLCRMISNRARWAQLHTSVNIIITGIIFSDVWRYYNELFAGIVNKESNIDNYFIIVLHIYHCIFFKNLSRLDYFHHAVFVLTGVVPCTFLLKSNISRFLTFTGCGLPGIIEYGSLVAMKNGLLTPIRQKQVNSYMYAYLRNPLAIFNVTFIYMAYRYYLLSHESAPIIIYIMLLSYFNGTFYNQLTIENYRDTYWKNKNR